MFFPLPRTYAVAQIDMPASLRGLRELDREACSAVETIRCSKAVIMLHTVCELPFPDRPDFKYFVYVVGPGLRPDKPELCYTADMCIPIFPNTEHPTGRPCVRTEPEFPFSHCYHWFCPDFACYVRVKNGTYLASSNPLAKYTKLPAGDWVDMETIHQQDVNRINDMLAERDKDKVQDDASATPHGGDLAEAQAPADYDDSYQDEDDSCFAPRLDDSDLDSLASGPSDYEESIHSSTSRGQTKSLTESEIFSMYWSEERARIPVITLTFDLSAEFPEDDLVPNPEAFIAECRKFSQAVQDFQEREALRREKREARWRLLKTFTGSCEKVAQHLKTALRRLWDGVHESRTTM